MGEGAMRTFGRWQVAGFIMAVGLCATAQTGSAQTRGMGRINGVVTESDGNTAVGDVAVKTTTSAGTASEGKTDARGVWRLPGSGKGVWPVEMNRAGSAVIRPKVTVTRERILPEPIKLTLKK